MGYGQRNRCAGESGRARLQEIVRHVGAGRATSGRQWLLRPLGCGAGKTPLAHSSGEPGPLAPFSGEPGPCVFALASNAPCAPIGSSDYHSGEVRPTKRAQCSTYEPDSAVVPRAQPTLSRKTPSPAPPGTSPLSSPHWHQSFPPRTRDGRFPPKRAHIYRAPTSPHTVGAAAARSCSPGSNFSRSTIRHLPILLHHVFLYHVGTSASGRSRQDEHPYPP